MNARSFLDTNILVYADDGDSPEKQKRAIEIILGHRAAGTSVVSLQVLQEYFAITTRKLGTDPGVARRKIEVLGQLDVVAPTLDGGYRSTSRSPGFNLGRVDRACGSAQRVLRAAHRRPPGRAGVRGPQGG